VVWLIQLPAVARRSPAITTPSANRTPRTVVPCVIWSGCVPSGSAGPGDCVRRSSSANEGPGSSEAEKNGKVIRSGG
jgi:hypothetical protein